MLKVIFPTSNSPSRERRLAINPVSCLFSFGCSWNGASYALVQPADRRRNQLKFHQTDPKIRRCQPHLVLCAALVFRQVTVPVHVVAAFAQPLQKFVLRPPYNAVITSFLLQCSHRRLAAFARRMSSPSSSVLSTSHAVPIFIFFGGLSIASTSSACRAFWEKQKFRS